jgi:hypothetical protein
MSSPFRFLRAGPPAPKLALLPDALFFTRTVPIAKGATAAEAAAQVELALESISPFPLAQLYYGWFWSPVSDHAFVFASYRRRFTPEQTAEWENAELVLPAFGAVLGAEVEAATTVLLASAEGVTAVHWENPPVPSKVIFRALPLDATDEDRTKAREELLREVGGSRKVVELESPLAADPAAGDREIVFRSGDFVSSISGTAASALDVRDKGELAALRTARKRDVLLWRVAVGCAIALLLLLVGEFALMAGRTWQQVRVRQYLAQKGPVDKIMKVDELTRRIEELATKRLLPLEMVTQLVGENLERKPEDIQFTSVQADQSRGLYTLFVQGKTTNPGLVNVYQNTLKALPSVEKVDAPISQVSGAQATFTLTVVFKPDALKPVGKAVVTTP